MALFSVEDYEFDSHDDRSKDRSDIAEKHAKGRGMGLNVSKRSHNFKQLQKAALRMRQKLEQENIRRHEGKEMVVGSIRVEFWFVWGELRGGDLRRKRKEERNLRRKSGMLRIKSKLERKEDEMKRNREERREEWNNRSKNVFLLRKIES